MLSEITAAKVDHGLASLAVDQLTGKAPPPGQISRAELARRAGVSETVISKIERIALAKAAAAILSQPDLPAHLRARLSQSLPTDH